MSALAAIAYPFDGGAEVALGDLVDPRSHGVLGFGWEEQVAVDVIAALRATYPVVADRRTRTHRFTLTVAKLHASLGAAFTFITTHTRELPGKVNLKLARDGIEVWLTGVGLPGRRLISGPESGGLTTLFEYELVGGQWSTTPPIPT